MELYCEERFINFPPDVEFHLNGVDAGEFLGNNPKNHPVGTPPTPSNEDNEDWDELTAAINRIIFESDAPPKNESMEVMFSYPDERELLGMMWPYYQEVQFPEMAFGFEPDYIPMVYDRPHKKKGKKRVERYCVFCKNNNAPYEMYMSHTVKDSLGKVTCPRLYRYQCPICKKSKQEAHTLKYCPEKPLYTMEDTIRMDFRARRSYRSD
ncbi:NANOS [Sergentomyia squamirostris]